MTANLINLPYSSQFILPVLECDLLWDFLQTCVIPKEVTELNRKVQFSSKVHFFGELWTELSSLFDQQNLNRT